MRAFDLINFQHVAAYVFPTLVFFILFFVALGVIHFIRPNSEERKTKIVHRYPDGLESRDAPFPLVMILIIVGTFIWGLVYTVIVGLTGVKL